MPVRRRTQRRRRDELQAWWGVFESRFDFFHEVTSYGSDEDLTSEFVDRAAEAWQRLGADFLAEWQPTQAIAVPWAVREFGEPEGVNRCR